MTGSRRPSTSASASSRSRSVHEVRPRLDRRDQRARRHHLAVERAEHGQPVDGVDALHRAAPGRAARRRGAPPGPRGSPGGPRSSTSRPRDRIRQAPRGVVLVDVLGVGEQQRDGPRVAARARPRAARLHRLRAPAAAGRPRVRRRPLDHASPPTDRSRVSTEPARLVVEDDAWPDADRSHRWWPCGCVTPAATWARISRRRAPARPRSRDACTRRPSRRGTPRPRGCRCSPAGRRWRGRPRPRSPRRTPSVPSSAASTASAPGRPTSPTPVIAMRACAIGARRTTPTTAATPTIE